MTKLYKSILIGFALTSVLFSVYFVSRFFEKKDCYYGDITRKIYCGEITE